MSLKKIFLIPFILGIFGTNVFAIEEGTGRNLYPEKYTSEYIVNELKPIYKRVSKEEVVYVALDMLNGTSGEFSRKAILGNNLSGRPVKVEFSDLKSFGDEYKDFDALGYKKGKKLYIFINQKHKYAPAGAIAALLAHEALHQDEYNSLAEETYAWTMEAVVWCEILRIHPETADDKSSALVARENTLKKLYERGKYSDKYIKKTVWSNAGYKNLPTTSPGFESL
ncbi:hypothetical protein J6S88_07990 [bacterium]|nr:hypothetical protein [bacterium]